MRTAPIANPAVWSLGASSSSRSPYRRDLRPSGWKGRVVLEICLELSYRSLILTAFSEHALMSTLHKIKESTLPSSKNRTIQGRCFSGGDCQGSKALLPVPIPSPFLWGETPRVPRLELRYHSLTYSFNERLLIVTAHSYQLFLYARVFATCMIWIISCNPHHKVDTSSITTPILLVRTFELREIRSGSQTQVCLHRNCGLSLIRELVRSWYNGHARGAGLDIRPISLNPLIPSWAPRQVGSSHCARLSSFIQSDSMSTDLRWLVITRVLFCSGRFPISFLLTPLGETSWEAANTVLSLHGSITGSWHKMASQRPHSELVRMLVSPTVVTELRGCDYC